MKKLLIIGLAGLFALTLVGCGNNETDSSATASKEVASEKVEKDLSNNELKSIFTSLSDSFVDLINAMTSDKPAKDKVSETEKVLDKTIELSDEVKIKLTGETSDAAVDLLEYATTMNTFATDTRDSNFDNTSKLSKELGRLQTLISKNHFDGFVPESVNNMAKDSNSDTSEKIEDEKLMQTYYGKMFGQTTDIFTSAMLTLQEENFIEAAKIASTVSEIKKDFNSNKSNLKKDQKKQDELINLAETLESMGTALATLDFEAATKHSVTFSENMFTISNNYFNGEFSKETQLYLDTFK